MRYPPLDTSEPTQRLPLLVVLARVSGIIGGLIFLGALLFLAAQFFILDPKRYPASQTGSVIIQIFALLVFAILAFWGVFTSTRSLNQATWILLVVGLLSLALVIISQGFLLLIPSLCLIAGGGLAGLALARGPGNLE